MASQPTCHLTYLPGSDRKAQPTAVWVCEYPYRTLRLDGPSVECEDCPVWRERQRARLEAAAAHAAVAQLRMLERPAIH
jgi:hypothetical protein